MEIKKREAALQFYRYIFSGFFAVTIHLIFLIFLVEVLNTNAKAATGIGFVMGSTFNYTAQYFWVFNATGPHKLMFLRYLLVTFLTFSVNLLIFCALHDLFAIDYITSQITTTTLVFLANFIINKYYTFELSRHE